MKAPHVPGPLVAASRDISRRSVVVGFGFAGIAAAFAAAGWSVAVQAQGATPTSSGLQMIPKSLYEAAEVDGASKWQQFWQVTIPMLMSSIIVALIFRTITALQTFDIPYTMTRGGPGNATETLAMLIHKTTIDYLDVGYGSTLANVFGGHYRTLSVGLSLDLNIRNTAAEANLAQTAERRGSEIDNRGVASYTMKLVEGQTLEAFLKDPPSHATIVLVAGSLVFAPTTGNVDLRDWSRTAASRWARTRGSSVRGEMERRPPSSRRS